MLLAWTIDRVLGNVRLRRRPGISGLTVIAASE
jgi:hypothetical protein